MLENDKNRNKKETIEEKLNFLKQKHNLTDEEAEQIRKGIREEIKQKELENVGRLLEIDTFEELSDSIHKILKNILEKKKDPTSPPPSESERVVPDFSRELKDILKSSESKNMLERLAGKSGNERLWIDHKGTRIQLKLEQDHAEKLRTIYNFLYEQDLQKDGEELLTEFLSEKLSLQARLDEDNDQTWKERWATTRREQITKSNMKEQWQTALESPAGLTVETVCQDTASALQVQDEEKAAFVEELSRLLTPFTASGNITNTIEFWKEFLTHARNALYAAEGWKKLEDVSEAQGITLASKKYEQVKIRTWEKIVGMDDKNAARNKEILDTWQEGITVYQHCTWKLASAPTAESPYYYTFTEGNRSLYVASHDIRICLKQKQKGAAWELKEPNEFQLLILGKPSETPPEPLQPNQAANPPPVAPPVQPSTPPSSSSPASPPASSSAPPKKSAKMPEKPTNIQNRKGVSDKDREQQQYRNLKLKEKNGNLTKEQSNILFALEFQKEKKEKEREKILKDFFNKKRNEVLYKVKNKIINLLEKGHTMESLQDNLDTLVFFGKDIDCGFLTKIRNSQWKQKLAEDKKIIQNAVAFFVKLKQEKKYSEQDILKCIRHAPLISWSKKAERLLNAG